MPFALPALSELGTPRKATSILISPCSMARARLPCDRKTTGFSSKPCDTASPNEPRIPEDVILVTTPFLIASTTMSFITFVKEDGAKVKLWYP